MLFKKALTTLLAIVLLLFSVSPAYALEGSGSLSYKDLGASHWAAKSLDKWIKLGLIHGYKDQTMRPKAPVTRAEFVSLINRLFSFSDQGSVTFSDVSKKDWFYKNVTIAQGAGYVSGDSNQAFRPKDPITRQEAAVMLYKVFSVGAVDGSLLTFHDEGNISGIARDAVRALTANGYLAGYADQTFKPDQSITRAEAVSLIDRIAGEIFNASGTFSNLKLKGNAIVSSTDVTLQNVSIAGDLHLAAGIGEGDAVLDKVTVKGKVFVSGGGANSIHAIASDLNKVIVDKDGVRVVLGGTVGELTIVSDDVHLEVTPGTIIHQLTIDESAGGANIESKGIIEHATANADVTINGVAVKKGSTFKVEANGHVTVNPTSSAASGTSTPTTPSSGPVNVPAIEATASVGDVDGTVRILVNLGNAHHAAIQISDQQLPTPKTGASIPVGDKVINPYQPGSNLSGIDAIKYKYIGVYLADLSNKVVGFKLLTISEDQIAQGLWQVVWHDEFDGSGTNLNDNGIDLDRWGFQEGTGAQYGLVDWGNAEQQYYNPNNARVEDGKLKIEAKKESFGGKPYSSARLYTQPTFSKKYGKFEARMKLPEGQGFWPAFWMMPTDSVYGGWATSGEIDIMEARGRLPNEMGAALHYGKAWPNQKSSTGHYNFPEGESIADFHVYGMEWEPGEIRFYTDGSLYAKINNWDSTGADQPAKYAFPAPFDQQFHMILNLAIGGNFDGGKIPDDTMLPATMEVDYVRVYELTGRAYKTPVEPSVTKEPLPEDAKVAVNGNYIYDPGFEEGFTVIATDGQSLDPIYWNFAKINSFGGDGSISVEKIGNKNFAKATIEKAGSEPHSIQLIQHVTLGKGRYYKVSFDAKSTANRNIVVKLGGGASRGWSVYSDSVTIPLTDEISSPPPFVFQMQAETDILARLEFNMGLNSQPVWIGNVKVEEVEGAFVDENAAKAPLNNGNHVYNGTFDLGRMDRMIYWNYQTNGANAIASVNEAARQLKTVITNGGNQASAVQLSQKGIQLIKDQQYALTFDMQSSKARTIEVELLSKDGATSYAKQTINLGTSMATKSLSFIMNAATDEQSQLIFHLGGSTDSILLDNVKLMRTSVYIDQNVVFYPLINGDFQDGMSPWETAIDSGGVIQGEIINNEAKLTVTNLGSNPWSAMFLQPHMSFTKGLEYILSFDAYSTVNRKMEFDIESEDGSYYRYVDETVQLTSTETHFEKEFTMTKNDLVGLKFFVGKVDASEVLTLPHDVFISNVVLQVKNAPVARSPRLMADMTNNVVGQPIEVAFKDDDGWRDKITAVKINGQTLANNHYNIVAGKITLSADQFSASGTYVIRIEANGYAFASVKQDVFAEPVPEPEGHELLNGSFQDGLNHWKIYLGDGAGDGNTDISVDSGRLIVNFINYDGWFPWSTQIFQEDLKLVDGKTYEVQYTITSSVNLNKSVILKIEKPGIVVLEKKEQLSTDSQTFTYQFTVSGGTTQGAKLFFFLGSDNVEGKDFVPHKIEIENVTLKEVV